MSEQPLHYLPWHSPWAYGAGFLGVAVGATLLAFLLPSQSDEISIAICGNSMLFVNDMPRFLQELGGKTAFKGVYKIDQQSCLHGSLNFKSLLYRGNGMAHKWNTSNAMLQQTDGETTIYDFGACTVTQLLSGTDDNLVEGNNNGYYTNDGKNPCFNDDSYFQYTETVFNQQEQTHHDFILLNDRTTWPAIYEKRYNSLQVLQESYVPLIEENGGIPILYATHGYESNEVDVSEFGGVSNFTSSVFEGYRQYAEILSENLPEQQQARIAPVGLAFLVVYEDKYDMWEKLFFVDGYHPSPHGTYLMGCVLFATLYGYMPGTNALPNIPENLWRRARKMQIGHDYIMPFPTQDEALYLYSVAEKVMMHGERPTSWIKYYDEATEPDYIGA